MSYSYAASKERYLKVHHPTEFAAALKVQDGKMTGYLVCVVQYIEDHYRVEMPVVFCHSQELADKEAKRRQEKSKLFDKMTKALGEFLATWEVDNPQPPVEIPNKPVRSREMTKEHWQQLRADWETKVKAATAKADQEGGAWLEKQSHAAMEFLKRFESVEFTFQELMDASITAYANEPAKFIVQEIEIAD